MLTIRNDLLGTNNPISSEELQQGLSAVNNGAFFDWVADLSNKSAFINRLDLMAAYHIINGKFFDNHSLFNKNIQNYIIPYNAHNDFLYELLMSLRLLQYPSMGLSHEYDRLFQNDAENTK